MKKVLILYILLNVFPNLFGQDNTLIDMFLLIPKENALETDINERQELVNFYKTTTSNIPENERIPSGHERFISVIDSHNGYLSMTGSYLEGIWEMTYWNISVDTKLIIVNYSVCQTSCWTQLIKIYKYTSGNELRELEIETVLPLKKVRAYLLKDNLTKTQFEELFEKGMLSENYKNLVFKLPRKGKSIIVKLGWDDSSDNNKFLKNRSCELILDNEAFLLTNTNAL